MSHEEKHCLRSYFVCKFQDSGYVFKVRWPTTVTSKPNAHSKLQSAHIKFKSLTSNSNRSQQIQIAHSKFKFLASAARHLAGNNSESWGGRGVTSSNQESKNNLATLVWGKSVPERFWSCFFTNTIEIRTELVRDKSMPASRYVVQDCNNGSTPREGISLHNSPPSGSVLSSWKRFVSPHRKNFNPTGCFVVCSKHITDDCFARSHHVGSSMKRLVQGAIPSVWKKKLKTIYFLVVVAL